MKYEKQIDDAFAQLGFTPRDGQREAVNQILVAYVDDNIKNVILSAPTGTGKSLIGAATAEALTIIRGGLDNSVKSSISLVSTNTLAKQYGSTFEKLAKGGKFIQIKGAANYDCSALYQPGQPENAEACAWFTMIQGGSEFESVISEHCNKCEFLEMKKRKNTTRHLTTNYSYFFIDRMYTGKFENRDLIIWDEAHLVNDLFSEHNAIYFSQKRLQDMTKEIAETVAIADMKIAKILSSVTKDCGIKDKINEKNYMSYLSALQEVYKYAKEQGDEAATRALRSNKMSSYSKYVRFTKKYEGLACKIDDLFKYGYEHVFEYKEDELAVSVKPIFVGTMIEALQCSSHNLFMSATVSGSFMTQTLNLNPEQTRFIKLPPTFPKENKEVVFFDPLSLSYVSLQNPDVIKTLRKNVAKIVKKHIEEGERGIILAPSFKLQDEIVSELRLQSCFSKYKLFEQRKGEKLEHILAAFKAYKGTALLISPSLFEGIDLPNDLSRYQVIVKAPFPSLGDKRMKFICDKFPDLYSTITIMKCIQGAGRSVRSMDDHATTYCLDANLQRLFTSKTNIWKEEFSFAFKSMLM